MENEEKKEPDFSHNPETGAPEDARITLIHYADHGMAIQIGENVDDEVVQHLISGLASTCTHMASSVMSGALAGGLMAVSQGKKCDDHVYPNQDQVAESEAILSHVESVTHNLQNLEEVGLKVSPGIKKRMDRLKKMREEKERKSKKSKKK